MQVNVQFLQQLIQAERQEIDTVSYHKLFDVLKQFQNEITTIRHPNLIDQMHHHTCNLLPHDQVTPQSESVSEEDSDPEQARRDKDMKKNLALLAK
ncbi:hypothetical protein Tco_1428594 [Tanacetum coccineum]